MSDPHFFLIVEYSKAFKQGDVVQQHIIYLVKNETQGIYYQTEIQLILTKQKVFITSLNAKCLALTSSGIDTLIHNILYIIYIYYMFTEVIVKKNTIYCIIDCWIVK